MKKEFVIVVAAVILLSILAVLPVISGISGLGDGNVTGVSKTKEYYTQMAIGETLRSGLIGTTAPVMSVAEDENATDVSKTNSATKAESIFDITKGEIISGVSIANKTNVSELELPVDIAATGDLVGKIAFASDRDGDFEIYVMDADGSNVVQLTSNYYPDSIPDWSPDCKKIAFTSNNDGYGEIYVMDADGSNVVQLTSNSAFDVVPDWSPDGSKIAFCSDRDGDLEIYVMDTDGTNVKKLTSNSATDEAPDWSPDGSKIVFVSDRDGYDKIYGEIYDEIYVMNADGSNVVQLTSNTARDYTPDWSPDDSKIAFASDRDGDLEIYVMDADGSNVVQLTSNTALDGLSYWSPDGSKIAFVSNRDGDGEIYVMDADGTNVKKLTSNTADDWNPVWSPNGSKIAFDSNKDGDDEIYVMDADGTNVVQLTYNLIADDLEPDWCCSVPSEQLLPILDTGDSSNPYPSIFGTHNGTLTPDQTITMHKLYTYPCSGTGGHSEYVKIWNEAWDGVEAYWEGYQEDGHNIIFYPPFTLEAGTTYNYTIVTGSYPQIIHESSKEVTGGRITCTEFTDANGHSYNNWIPAIRLEGLRA